MKTINTIYTNFAKRMAMTMMVLMTIAVGFVWADTYTWTLKSGDLAADFSSVTKGLPQTTWQTTYTWTTSQTYFGYDTQLGRGLQIGSSEKSCQKAVFTTNGISGSINSIKINSSGNANATINVTIGGESVISSNLTTSATDYTSGAINKSGTIEITLSNNGEKKALYIKSIVIEYTPDGSSAPTPEPDPNYTYVATLVTDASDLSVDDQIMIVAKNADVALSTTQNDNNRGQATVKKENSLVYFNDDAQLITLEEGTVDKTFAFNVGNGYLYAASSSKNYLKTQQTNNANGSWSISITNEGVATIKAQGTYTHNWVQYNSNSSLFSCYNSSQQSVVIYKYESCTNSVSIEQGTMENVNSMTFSTERLKTCTNTDAKRQVTISITPESCYTVPNNTRLTVSGTNATYENGPTADGNGNYTFVYQFAKDATGTAYISASLDTPKTYTINYNKGANGQGEDASDIKICDEDLTLKGAIFTRLGYNQVGWSTTDMGNKEYELDDTYSNNADITLYPAWQAKSLTNYRTLCEYEVTWLVGGEEYIAGTPTTTVQAGKTITTLPTNPTDNALGCCSDKFMGWTTSTAKTIENQYLYETIEEIQEKFPSIYEDLTFRAVFATTAQGVGTSIADFSEMGYENATAVTAPIFLGDGEGRGDATITLAKAQSSSNAPTYYTDGEAVRIYAGGTITIASTYNNATIKNIVFTFAGNDVVGENTITASSGTYDNGTWTGNASTVTFTIAGSTGHRRIASITVTTGVTGSQYTNYVTSCDKMNDPSLGAVQLTYSSGDAIAVNCGNLSSKNSAASITFPNAINLTCPITVTAPAGFVLATNQQSDTYTQTVLIKPVKTAGENKGKITKTVYVRADAPENSETDYSSNITITGEEITETTVTVKADVTCKTYTFKTLTHIGDEHTSNTYYAGQIIEVAPVEPVKDACSENYTFDGWSTSEVEYGSVAYSKVTFPYTMPAKDVTLYPVYSINDTKDYHRVTSDLGANNWAGDYLIAFSDQIFADGRFGGTGDAAIGKANVQAEDFSTAIVNDVVPADPYGNRYHVTLESVSGGYLLKTQDRKYNYHTNNSDNDLSASESASTAGKYTINVEFISDSDIRLCLSGNALGSVFRYGCGQSGCFFRFYNDCGGKPIYLYKKSPLYTSYLACGTISVSEEEVYVTATKQRGIMANQPLTVTANNMYPNAQVIVTSNNADVYFSAKRDANFAMAAANQPQQSLTLTANETGALSQSIYIHYRPSSEGDGVPADVEVTAQSHNLPISDNHTIHVRNLPAKFVLATKVGAVWYALPANMTEPTNPSGVVIEVDETNMTAIAPNTTVYTLFPVATVNGDSDRYKEYGERLRFAAVNNGNRGLWANDAKSGTTINNDAAITAANSTAGAACEWKITTTIVDGNWQYTLQTDQSNNQKYLRYWTAASGGAKWGTYASGNDKLYFLPVTETKPFDYKVVEWYPTKVLIQTDAAITNPIVKIGGILVDNVTCTNKGGKLYEISGLSLAENPTKVLTLSYTADEVTYTNSKVVPIILSRETKSISGEPFVALTKEVYNYADLVVRDGATLTMDGTQEANTLWDVTIYPTSKISVPESKKLTVHSLTFFGGIDDIYDGEKYTTNKYGVPQLSLKGTLGKTVTTMDYIMRVDLEQMYQVGVPYDVNLNEITYWDGASIALGTALYVSAYDGAARARLDWDNTWQWEVNFVDKVLKAGIGYTISAEPQVAGDTYSILRMPMKNNINSGNTETQKATINVTAHGMSDENLTDNHKGWNYLSNPYMTSISGAESGGVDNNNIVVGYLVETGKGPWEWKNDTYRYVTIPYDDGTNYYQRKFSEATLLPFKSFFLQIANSGDLSFALASRLNAPMRHLQQQENAPREVEFELLLSNDAQSDNTGLLISEEFTPAYEINADLEKMTGTMSVYTIYNGYQLAYNALSPLNAMEEIPLGYVVPTTGEYTFNLDERGDLDDIEHIYLLDHDSSITTDLMEDIYTFTATEKKNDHRFAISVILKAEEEEETPTHLETLEWESDHPYKFIYQDKMYILRNGVIYDAMGKQVQTINK